MLCGVGGILGESIGSAVNASPHLPGSLLEPPPAVECLPLERGVTLIIAPSLVVFLHRTTPSRTLLGGAATQRYRHKRRRHLRLRKLSPIEIEMSKAELGNYWGYGGDSNNLKLKAQKSKLTTGRKAIEYCNCVGGGVVNRNRL